MAEHGTEAKKARRKGPYGRKKLAEESNKDTGFQTSRFSDDSSLKSTFGDFNFGGPINHQGSDADGVSVPSTSSTKEAAATFLRRTSYDFEEENNEEDDNQLGPKNISSDSEAGVSEPEHTSDEEAQNLDDSALPVESIIELSGAPNVFDDFELEELQDESFAQIPERETDEDVKPLFPGAKVTLGAFMLMLAVFTTKYNLVGDGIQQLLNILAIVLPNEHTLCSTLHEFKSYFKKLKNPLVKHHYCPKCHSHIEDRNSTECSQTFCRFKFSEKKPYFIEVPLQPQIQTLFSKESFYDNLQSRFQQNSSGLYRDIYDGSLYKSYMSNDGPLSSPDNISFTLNTDGASVFKSSNVSIWPIYLAVNELPYKIRMKSENMLLAGLWFGNEKPTMSTFLQPLLKTFKAFEEGFKMIAPGREEFICRGYLMCCTADLPARCLLTNSVQYNGAFSCWKCTQKGITAKVGKGNCHVYPFCEISPKGPKRKENEVEEDARTAVKNKMEHKRNFMQRGIKGPSWLSLFPAFHIIDGIAIDYMHGVLLGVQKLLLRLWFSADFAGKTFNYRGKVCQADVRLESLKPTSDITRLPRSIEHHLKYWKASEYRSFLLYYGAVILYGLIDDNRFFHYLSFVNAIHIFLKCGSSDTELGMAENMIFSFCKLFSNLYDGCYMTLNLHQLVHLADSVRCLGPLYVSSCFPFEDKNGFMMKMIRGTQNIDSQIISGVSFVQKLPELKQRCLVRGSIIDSICYAIEHPNSIIKREMLASDVYALGAKYMKSVQDDEYRALNSTLTGICPLPNSFCCFNRIEFKGQYIYGGVYQRMSKRNNSAVIIQQENVKRFGLVRFFVDLSEPDEAQTEKAIVALVDELECDNFTTESHILRVKKNNQLLVVPLVNFVGSCIFLESNNIKYICMFPNRMECD